MAGTTGKRRASKHSSPRARTGSATRLKVAGMAAAALASGVAWWFLVRAAIDFGALARGGETVAWAFCVAASAGAALCLLLVLVLGARALRALGLVSEYTPRRAGGRRSTPPGQDSDHDHTGRAAA